MKLGFGRPQACDPDVIGTKCDKVRFGSQTDKGLSLAATEYRGYAAECLRLAHQMGREEDRARLLNMAEAWLELAEKLEAQSTELPVSQD